MSTSDQPNPPTPERYVDALRRVGDLSDNLVQMLRLHFHADNKTATADELAVAGCSLGAWWACRDKYRIVISQVVIDECSAGDSTAATERLELLADMEVLALEGRNRTMRVMNPAASVAFDYGL